MKNIIEMMNDHFDHLDEKIETFHTPAPIKKVGNKIKVDLTKPGAYLPAEWYHPEDDIYEDR